MSLIKRIKGLQDMRILYGPISFLGHPGLNWVKGERHFRCEKIRLFMSSHLEFDISNLLFLNIGYFSEKAVLK